MPAGEFEPTRKVICPRCGAGFSVPLSRTRMQCSVCGARGSVGG